MSKPNPLSMEKYLSRWAHSVCHVLGQISGLQITCQPISDQQANSIPSSAQDCWFQFASAHLLPGEQAFQISPPDSVRLAQMLLCEPLDPAAVFSADHRDALEELMRQFAGIMSSSLKEPLGGEVGMALANSSQPAWNAAHRAAFRFNVQQDPPLALVIHLNSELVQALQPSAAFRSPDAPPASDQAPSPADASSPLDINLLMDISLEAHLYFGDCKVLLRDVLEYAPGTVVELNRLADQPAEVWIAGKRMALGEMVIVDGNYGLRITEIASPSQRIQSLQSS